MFILYTLRLTHTLHLLAEKRIKKKINHHQDRITRRKENFIFYLYNIFLNTHSKIYLQHRIPSSLLCFGSDFIFSNIFYIEGYDINPHPLRRQINHNNGSHYKLFIVEMLVFENIQRSMYTVFNNIGTDYPNKSKFSINLSLGYAEAVYIFD